MPNWKTGTQKVFFDSLPEDIRDLMPSAGQIDNMLRLLADELDKGPLGKEQAEKIRSLVHVLRGDDYMPYYRNMVSQMLGISIPDQCASDNIMPVIKRRISDFMADEAKAKNKSVRPKGLATVTQ